LAVKATGPTLFTTAQAEKGEKLFMAKCRMCHIPAEQVGPSFQAKWGRTGPAPLFRYISIAMPQDKPASLSKAEYASLVAFYLRESGFAPGAAELPSELSALERIRYSDGKSNP
jgi:cytochrome c2